MKLMFVFAADLVASWLETVSARLYLLVQSGQSQVQMLRGLGLH